MSNDVKIDLQDNSPYRIALELTWEIARRDKEGAIQSDPRGYLLNLYEQCRHVVLSGWSAEQAMGDRKK